MTTTTRSCPRCAADLTAEPGGGALSRVDNTTYICSDCGLQEALFNLFRPHDPLPPLTEHIPGPIGRLLPTPDFIEPGERSTIAKIFSFAEVLRAASAMPPDEDEYWEKPWKWDPEYQTWVRHGQPWPDGDTEASRALWDDFVRALIGEQS